MHQPGIGVETMDKIEPFRILPLITNSQQKHGLRHENYQRYRGYCTRRIERIRKSLKFLHSHKCLPNRPAKFIARCVTPELISDIRFLQIVIYEIERNWAYAMQLKLELMDAPHSRKKFHMRQKMRRAAKSALLLESLTEKNPLVHEITQREVKSYTTFIYGSLAIELKNWKKAISSFDASRLEYMELLEQTKGTELSEMYSAKCREMENLLNLCRSHAGDPEFLQTISSINLNASEEEQKPAKDDKQQKEGKVKEKKQQKRTSIVTKEPKPIKPLFFDLALNFVKAD